jgi:DNA gyrase/topoisomerase IV subunit A
MIRVTSDMYAEYLRYTNRFRHIPYYIDALKLVERRILLTLNDVAKVKLIKSARVVGDTIGKLHPHGDVSTYDALVGLVNRGFAVGSGNWGRPGFLEDDRAAAYRYSECKVQKGLNDIIMEFLDYVPWEEIEYANEPIYYANPIPIGLVGSDFITGIGVDTIKCPRYSSNDLFKRLLYLLNNQTPETIIPNISGCDIYEEEPGEFERILQTGKGSVQVVPKITKRYDHIIIEGRSPLKGFGPLIAFNNKWKDKNKIEYFEHVDLSGDRMPLEIQIYPPRNAPLTTAFTNTIWQKISQKVNVICNFIGPDLKTEIFGIDTLLVEAYKNWKETHLVKLNDDQRRAEKKIFELDVVQVVRDIMTHNPNCKRVDDVIAAFIPHQKHFPMIHPDDIKGVVGKFSIKALIEKDLNQQDYRNEVQQIIINKGNIDKLSIDRVNGYVNK